MARSVADVALLLSVMAGPDPRDPGVMPSDPAVFRGRLERDLRGTRVAWCPDLGGLPLDPRVRAVLDGAARRRSSVSAACVEDACPDLAGADDGLPDAARVRGRATTLGPLLAQHRDKMKPEAIEEIEAGQALTSADVAQAMVQHGQMLERMRRFQERYELSCCAVNQVPPFDATLDWPQEIDGVAMEHYIAWMKSAYWITRDVLPAISVPAGFTPEGSAGRPADRRPPRGRLRRAAVRARVRAGDGIFAAAASARLKM